MSLKVAGRTSCTWQDAGHDEERKGGLPPGGLAQTLDLRPPLCILCWERPLQDVGKHHGHRQLPSHMLHLQDRRVYVTPSQPRDQEKSLVAQPCVRLQQLKSGDVLLERAGCGACSRKVFRVILFGACLSRTTLSRVQIGMTLQDWALSICCTRKSDFVSCRPAPL